jgi:hypothetical protein
VARFVAAVEIEMAAKIALISGSFVVWEHFWNPSRPVIRGKNVRFTEFFGHEEFFGHDSGMHDHRFV